MKSPAVEPLISPAQHARLGRAERLKPAAVQIDVPLAPRRYLLGLVDDRRVLRGLQPVGFGYRLVRLPRVFERCEQLFNPAVQSAFSVVLDERLHDADGEAVFGAVKAEGLFSPLQLLLLSQQEERLDR